MNEVVFWLMDGKSPVLGTDCCKPEICFNATVSNLFPYWFPSCCVAPSENEPSWADQVESEQSLEGLDLEKLLLETDTPLQDLSLLCNHSSSQINPRPITGAHNHRQQHQQQQRQMGPIPSQQFRGYLHSKPPPPPHPAVIPFHDPYDMSGFLPPPEYLRKMPPPVHNNPPLPMPKLPCTTSMPEPFDQGMQHRPVVGGNGFYPPPPPPPWRALAPQNIYRNRPPLQQGPTPPAVNVMGGHGQHLRHFRSGSAMELHGR